MARFIVGRAAVVLFLSVCFLVYATICCGEASFKVSLSKVPFFGIFVVFFLSVLDDILWVPIHCNVHPVIQRKVMRGKRTRILT